MFGVETLIAKDFLGLRSQLKRSYNNPCFTQYYVILSGPVSIFLHIFIEACKFDFENGLHGWEKTGTAFNNQPTYGDNPTARNRGQPAKQQGDWWIGGAEDRPSIMSKAGLLQGDRPQGTITSPPFEIMGSLIAFLIGGGCDINSVRAELIVNNKVRIMNVNTFE